MNRTPWRVISTGINGCIPAASGSGTSSFSICVSSSPLSVCIWNARIGNIEQTNIPSFSKTIELHTSINIILSNISNASSVGIQVLRDELSISSEKNLYLRLSMDITADTIQPMGPQLVSHGLLTIDTLKEKYWIWIPTTSAIIRTQNTTHDSASGHAVGQRTVVGEAVGKYREENNKTFIEIAKKIRNFKASAKMFKRFNHLWI